MQSDHYEGMVTRLEFCRQIKITTRTARRWHQDNYGPQPRYVGGRVYYLQDDIDRFMADVKRPSVVA